MAASAGAIQHAHAGAEMPQEKAAPLIGGATSEILVERGTARVDVLLSSGERPVSFSNT